MRLYLLALVLPLAVFADAQPLPCTSPAKLVLRSTEFFETVEKLQSAEVSSEDMSYWMKRANGGDRQAQDLVSRAIYQHAERVLRLMGVKDPDKLDRLSQDVVTGVFRNQFKYDIERGAFSTYLYPVVRSALRQTWRSPAYRNESLGEKPLDEAMNQMPAMISMSGRRPDEALVEKESRQVLVRNIEKIKSSVNRQMVKLRILEGLTNEEAVERLGITKATASARFKAGEKELYQLMAKEFPELETSED